MTWGVILLKRALSVVEASLSPHLKLFYKTLLAIHQDNQTRPHESTDVGKTAWLLSEAVPTPKSRRLYDFFYQVILAYNTATVILEEEKEKADDV